MAEEKEIRNPVEFKDEVGTASSDINPLAPVYRIGQLEYNYELMRMKVKRLECALEECIKEITRIGND